MQGYPLPAFLAMLPRAQGPGVSVGGTRMSGGVSVLVGGGGTSVLVGVLLGAGVLLGSGGMCARQPVDPHEQPLDLVGLWVDLERPPGQ